MWTAYDVWGGKDVFARARWVQRRVSSRSIQTYITYLPYVFRRKTPPYYCTLDEKKKFFRVFDAYLSTLTADILKVLYMWNLSRNNITSGVSNIFKELKVKNPIWFGLSFPERGKAKNMASGAIVNGRVSFRRFANEIPLHSLHLQYIR